MVTGAEDEHVLSLEVSVMHLGVLVQVREGSSYLTAGHEHLAYQELSVAAGRELTLEVVEQRAVSTQLGQQETLVALLVRTEDLHDVGMSKWYTLFVLIRLKLSDEGIETGLL